MTERKIANGKLIVIEGTDGSGKHTQAEKLYNYLLSSGWNVKLGGFPMYSENYAGKIVDKMLHGKYGDLHKIDPILAALPFALDRAEAQPMLREHLNNGGIWILDRYVVSNWAHGASKYENDEEAWEYIQTVKDLEFEGQRILQPDLNIFLRVPPVVSQNLMKARAKLEGRELDQAEKNVSYQERTLYFYDEFVKDPKNKIVAVDCEDGEGGISSVEEIHNKVLKFIALKFPELIKY